MSSYIIVLKQTCPDKRNLLKLPSHPTELKWDILERTEFLCDYCYNKEKNLELFLVSNYFKSSDL